MYFCKVNYISYQEIRLSLNTFHHKYPVKIFQDKAVRLVHHACVKRCEIDARGLFRIMSHALPDDRKRDVLALGNARPTMPGNVHGQRYGQSCQTGDFLQRHIDAADGVTILWPLIGAWVGDYRQEVAGGRILSILGDDVFHALLPLTVSCCPVFLLRYVIIPFFKSDFSDRPYQ